MRTLNFENAAIFVKINQLRQNFKEFTPLNETIYLMNRNILNENRLF